MKLKNMYLNLSIKYKLVLLFFSVIVLITLTLGIYSYFISQSYIVNRISDTNLGVVKQINSNINFIQKDLVDLSTYISINQDVRSRLDKWPADSESSFSQGSNILEFIAKLLASKSYISSVIIYDREGRVIESIFSDASTGAQDASSTKEKVILDAADTLNGRPLWFSIEKQSYNFIQNNYSKKIAMCKVIKDVNFSRHVGFLILCINEETIQEMYIRNIQSDKEGILIADKEGNLISGYGSNIWVDQQDREQLYQLAQNSQEGYLLKKIANKTMLISYSSDNTAGWKIYYSVPVDILTRETNSIKTFTFILIFVCLFISFLLMFHMSSLVTAPIKKLTASMQEFQQGNFDTKVDFKFKDEIGVLGEGYNNMVVNIKQLIDKNYILQIKERESELNALQAQINPHFLYNTLETIFWEAEEAGQSKISEMVINLSSFFRLSLNRGKNFTLVSKEKDLIEYYLNLQKIRFKDRMNFTMDFDENTLDCLIPKLLLQPFVENAIIHGIEGKPAGGSLYIGGRLCGDSLHFIIKDDGIGMTEDAIENLFIDRDPDNFNTSPNPGGYAVKNVADRLKLYFNDHHSLKFTSRPGAGTSVELIIPAKKLVDEQEN